MVSPECNTVHWHSFVTISASLQSEGTPPTVCFMWACVPVIMLIVCLLPCATAECSFSLLHYSWVRGKVWLRVWHRLLLLSVPCYTGPVQPHFSHYKFLIDARARTQNQNLSGSFHRAAGEKNCKQVQVELSFVLTLCLQEHTALINGDNQITTFNE